MSWWQSGTLGSLVAIGWILTGRILISQSKTIGGLRERVAWLEAKVNGRDRP